MRIPKSSEESIEDMLNEAEHDGCDAPIEQRSYYVAAITRSGKSTSGMHVSELFDFEQDDMGEPEKEDSLDEALQEATPHENVPKAGPTIEGSPELQESLRNLLNDYCDLLKKEVDKKAAAVPPMKLNVDEKRWTLYRSNTQRHRAQSAVKDAEIQRQVQLMLELNLIRPSTRNRWSQVHLVPKPNGKWRFCMDYRFLNECSKMEGGVLPRIKEMLHRIGDKKTKYYAVMDLTSGYHQAPLDHEASSYTAFVTSKGVFEWVRVPMRPLVLSTRNVADCSRQIDRVRDGSLP